MGRNKLNLKKILVGAAIMALPFTTPKSLEAKTSGEIPKDTTKTEEVHGTLKNELGYNINSNIASNQRFWGMPFANFPVYSQSVGATKGKLSTLVNLDVNLKDNKLYTAFANIGYSQSLGDVHPSLENFLAHAGATGFRFNLGEEWGSAAIGYLGLTTDFPLNPSIFYKRLIGFGDGNFIQGEISENIPNPLSDKNKLKSSLSVGYNIGGLIEGRDITEAKVNVSAPINLGKFLVTPSTSYHFPLPKSSGGFIFGISASAKF